MRSDIYAGGLPDVFSAAHSVSETVGRCAIRHDEYDRGASDGDVENDDT